VELETEIQPLSVTQTTGECGSLAKQLQGTRYVVRFYNNQMPKALKNDKIIAYNDIPATVRTAFWSLAENLKWVKRV
jgi:hypothetical protein